MKPKLYKLENGVRVITTPMPTLESATVTIWAAVGSRYEQTKVSGISHFLEHMVFKGSKKRPTPRSVLEAIDSIGGEFNAGTAKEYTNFYVKASADHLDKSFDVLSDSVLNPLLKSEETEKEKGVILEEIAMYNDTPRAKIWDIFENLIYSGNPLGRDIIGTRKSVKSISRKNFVDFRKTHYHSENILVTVAGGVKESQVIALSEKYFSAIDKNSKSSKFKKFAQMQNSPRLKLHHKDSDQAHLILGFPSLKRGHKDRYAQSVLSSALGGGMSSRLFMEVREKRGLAYSVYTSVGRSIDTGYFSVYAGVDPRRIDEAIKVILSVVYETQLGKYAVKGKELKKAKEMIKGHLALSLEDTEKVNGFFGTDALFKEDLETPEQVMEKIDKITTSEATSIAKKVFDNKKVNLAIIGPFKNEDRFENLLHQ